MFNLLIALTCLKHLSIFIVILCILLILYRKGFKKPIIRIISVGLVFVALLSYFVGVSADSKIQYDTSINTKQEEYFYVSSNDNSFCYYGKIYVFDKNKDDINYNELFDDGDVFQLGLSKIGKYIFDKKVGFKEENKDGNIIIYSPVVLVDGNFLIGRNNYAGYVVMENNEKITVISYELWFKESSFNDFTFMKIYSEKFQINVSDILSNIVSKEDYQLRIVK